jgi:hypothetical protein
MNYSTFNQTYGSPNRGDILRPYDGIDDPHQESTQQFPLYSEGKSKGRVSGYEKAAMVTKGIMCEDNLDPVTVMFFSNENISRIQRMMRVEITRRTKGKYRLDGDQDESDLLVAMRAVLFDANVGARYLPFKIKRQVKDLNRQVVQHVVPDMIEAMKQQYGYLKEINQPLQPMMRPMNVSSAGRKTLPSITTIFGR